MPSAKKTKKTKKPQPKVSLAELMEAADQAVDLEQALHLLTAAEAAALEEDPSLRVDIYEKRAAIRVSVNQIEEAMNDYQLALNCVVDPERQAGLYMYMGQLCQGEEALTFYQQAIERLEQVGEKQQLATAYCTVAEVYLTDLCFASDAEQRCEGLLQKAMALDSNLPDALQTCASLRLSQCRPMDAVDMILKAFDSMKVGCHALAKLVGLRDDPAAISGAVELQPLMEVQKLPEFEFRCETAKILLECASHHVKAQECVQAAIDVIGSLLAENDEVVEIWALAGDAFAALEDPDLAQQYWETALGMISNVQQTLEQQQQQGFDDDEEEEAVHQQLEDVLSNAEALKAKIKNLSEKQEASMEK